MTGSLSEKLLRVLIVLCASIYLFALWVTRDNFNDFRILHLGGRLIKDGRPEEAYSADLFREAWVADPTLDGIPAELEVFISTPPFALAMRPFSYFSSDVGLALWLALGIIALFAAIRLLRLPLWFALVGLALPMGATNVFLGQTGFFALLWVATIWRLCAEDRPAAAGLVAGLAVLKPTLLLGVAIWWLIDWRRWQRALLSAAAVGSAIMVPTLFNGFEHYRLFQDALEAYGDNSGFNQPTIMEFVNRALGTTIGSHPAATATYLLVGVGLMVAAQRQWPDQPDVLCGAAVIVSVLVSPHLLIYDTVILFIPFAVARHRGATTKTQDLLVALVVITSLLNILPIEPFPSINQWTIPSTVGLIAAGWLWISAIDSPVDGLAIRPTTVTNSPQSPSEMPDAA